MLKGRSIDGPRLSRHAPNVGKTPMKVLRGPSNVSTWRLVYAYGYIRVMSGQFVYWVKWHIVSPIKILVHDASMEELWSYRSFLTRKKIHVDTFFSWSCVSHFLLYLTNFKWNELFHRHDPHSVWVRFQMDLRSEKAQ